MNDFETHPASEPTPSDIASETSEDLHLSFSEAEKLDDLGPDRLSHLENCGYCTDLVDTLNPTARLLLDFSDRTKGVIAEDTGTLRKVVSLGGWVVALPLAFLMFIGRSVPETAVSAEAYPERPSPVALAAEAIPFWLVDSGDHAAIVLARPSRDEAPAGYFTSSPPFSGQRVATNRDIRPLRELDQKARFTPAYRILARDLGSQIEVQMRAPAGAAADRGTFEDGAAEPDELEVSENDG